MIFLSFIFIFLIHHLITFLTGTLTVPKVKDLVNIPTKKYEKIINTIQETENSKRYENDNNINNNNTNNSNNSNHSMKEELKSFLKTQMSNNDSPAPIPYEFTR